MERINVGNIPEKRSREHFRVATRGCFESFNIGMFIVICLRNFLAVSCVAIAVFCPWQAIAATQPPPFEWVRNAGSAQGELSWAVAIDSATNVYITGYFHNTTTFGTNVLSA